MTKQVAVAGDTIINDTRTFKITEIRGSLALVGVPGVWFVVQKLTWDSNTNAWVGFSGFHMPND